MVDSLNANRADSRLQAAQYYATRGWPVLPIKPGEKVPMTAHGVKDATTDKSILIQWWDRCEDANIGIATGKLAGVWVLDIDGEAGDRSLTDLENKIGPLPETLEQKTGGGGRQLFFRWPDTREIRNKQNIRPGIDVRGEGGYVVVPPSLHPSGQRYEWPHGDSTTIAAAPKAWLDLIAPIKRRPMPWDRQAPVAAAPPPVPASVVKAPIITRAKKYLAECNPPVQGSGGHNDLLWAARAMVIGFQLDDANALSLLWSEFNPRCTPPWDRGNPKDVKDFERKVGEARRTTGDKPVGWLLDEYGLRDDANAMAQIAKGRESQINLLASAKAAEPQATDDEADGLPERRPFPLHCFPTGIRNYVELVADVQIVDPAAVGLLTLVMGGAAMGNSFWLRLKRGFVVPPVLWGAVIAPSGSNKSGPFREVVKPLRKDPAIDGIENALLNPQGQLIIEDTTTEAVIDVLSRSARGLCLANPELSGWAASFDRYVQGGKKKASGDESVWLKLWDGDPYQKNRRTESENVFIARAAVSVIGCIQPQKMAECFDPSSFASGLVPRLLVVEIPPFLREWSEREMPENGEVVWAKAIEFLRTQPFASLHTNTGEYVPNFIVPCAAAKEHFVGNFNELARLAFEGDEWVAMFAKKAQGMAGRLTLVLHGFGAAVGEHDIKSEVSEQTMRGGVELARYFFGEQLRLYGLATGQCTERRLRDDLIWIKTKKNSPGRTTVREFQKHHSKRFSGPGASKRARAALQEMIDRDLLAMDGGDFVVV
jgi:hypothetical protein